MFSHRTFTPERKLIFFMKGFYSDSNHDHYKIIKFRYEISIYISEKKNVFETYAEYSAIHFT